MPVFDWRTEAKDGSGHFRNGSVRADTKKDAERIIRRRELKLAAHEMEPEFEAALLEQYGLASIDDFPQMPPRTGNPDDKVKVDEKGNLLWHGLPGSVRSQIAAHRLEEPYELVECKERK
jgi:Type II secretory pathway, component PulF